MTSYVFLMYFLHFVGLTLQTWVKLAISHSGKLGLLFVAMTHQPTLQHLATLIHKLSETGSKSSKLMLAHVLIQWVVQFMSYIHVNSNNWLFVLIIIITSVACIFLIMQSPQVQLTHQSGEGWNNKVWEWLQKLCHQWWKLRVKYHLCDVDRRWRPGQQVYCELDEVLHLYDKQNQWQQRTCGERGKAYLV